MIRILRVIAIGALAAMTAGCAAPYYWQAIGGQLELLRKREPIDEVVADAGVDPTLKNTLTRIAAMRRFSVDELQLPSNESYTTYVALDRPYVVWNVVATEEFSVDPRRWCFPFAGCVAYRGYFDRSNAERFAKELAAEGLDVHSGGSTAYSTLGYFAGSRAEHDGQRRRAVCRELAVPRARASKALREGRQRVQRSVSLPSSRSIGTERRLPQHDMSAELERYRARRERAARFGELIDRAAALRLPIASGASAAQLREDKARAFDTLRGEFEALKAGSWQGNTDHDAWFAQPLNNATLWHLVATQALLVAGAAHFCA